jgi:hypothetical protein
MNWDNPKSNEEEDVRNDYILTYMDALCQVSAVLKYLCMGATGSLECRSLNAIVTDHYTTNITVIKRVAQTAGNLPIHLVVFAVLCIHLCLSVLQFLTNLPR